MKSIINAIYYKATYDKTYTWPDEIIERFSYVHNNRKNIYKAYKAKITDIEGGETLEYPVGTQCIILKDDTNEGYESIVFNK